MAEYFYQPRNGHGLAHDPFNAIIGPRPIGWISTRGADGSVNLAPYSFFNAFNYHPPIIGFASLGAKDTLRNARETGELVWNLVTRELFAAMNESSALMPYGVSEFARAGVSEAKARLVRAPMVAEARVRFECLVADIVQLKSAAGVLAESWLVLAEVVAVHIDEALLVEGVFDTFGAGIMLRGGGASAYAEISPAARRDLKRPL
ncbi:flavin reductase family protein [Acidocella sp.]|uniref:flavin reductase family protein n=1 Tax=Acidocella sp. TaxID=50710 RepID=UPI002619E876|nr:flavin reductase family protein [Acidocella sp.]